MITLKRLEMQRLYYAMHDKLQDHAKRKGVEMPSNKLAIIGYSANQSGKKAKESVSLTSSIKESERVKDFLNKYNKSNSTKAVFTSRDLYEKLRRFDSGEECFNFSGIYEFVYFNFLGYNNKDEFFRNNPIEVASVNFTCLFFSPSTSKVENIFLEFQELFNGEQAVRLSITGSENDLPGSLQQLHDSLIISARSDNSYYHLILSGRHLFRKEWKKILAEPFISGMISGFANSEYPFSSKCILINRHIHLDKVQETTIGTESIRYLNIKRSAFNILPDQIGKDELNDKMIIRGNDIDVGIISHMASKVYRIVTTDPTSRRIFQSKFRIEHDYRAYFSDVLGNKLECSLSLNKIFNPKLLVLAYERDGESLSTFAAIEIPRIIRTGTVIKGMYCSVGSNYHSLFGNRFVMIHDDSNFEPCEISRTDYKQRNDKILNRLYDELIGMNNMEQEENT